MTLPKEAKPMAKQKPSEVTAKIVDLLEPLSSDERKRVIQAALTLVGEAPLAVAGGDGGGDTSELPQRARQWAKQNGLALDNLQQVFNIAADGVEVIAAEVPGKSKKVKTYNAYVLAGVAKL